jgi:hypothetical protein
MLVNANGQSVIDGKRVIKITDSRLSNIAAMADEPFRVLHLTVVCPDCGGTPSMQNAPTDAEWAMDCACTTRRLVNAYTQ